MGGVLKQPYNLAAPFIEEIALERGWLANLHPDGGFAGTISRPGGPPRWFMRSTYDLNRAAAWHAARDKALTKHFLEGLGYPVVPGRSFFSEARAGEIGSDRGPAAAAAFAKEIGYPVMVKPNSLSGGRGVRRVSGPDRMGAALDAAFACDEVVLVEEFISDAQEFRVVVLDGRILLAYERIPFAVIGDGTSTLEALVTRSVFDPGLRERLLCGIGNGAEQVGVSLEAIPRRNERIQLSDAANLEQGGMARDVTEALDSRIAEMAREVPGSMGLRFCGVDLLAIDDLRSFYILELNASPTIHHFAAQTSLSHRRLYEFFDAVMTAMMMDPG